VYYWLADRVKFGYECYYVGENWEKLKDGNQVISISWDQSYDQYLVAFKVEEEK
jgi:hypothetical protein